MLRYRETSSSRARFSPGRSSRARRLRGRPCGRDPDPACACRRADRSPAERVPRTHPRGALRGIRHIGPIIVRDLGFPVRGTRTHQGFARVTAGWWAAGAAAASPVGALPGRRRVRLVMLIPLSCLTPARAGGRRCRFLPVLSIDPQQNRSAGSPTGSTTNDNGPILVGDLRANSSNGTYRDRTRPGPAARRRWLHDQP